MLPAKVNCIPQIGNDGANGSSIFRYRIAVMIVANVGIFVFASIRERLLEEHARIESNGWFIGFECVYNERWDVEHE